MEKSTFRTAARRGHTLLNGVAISIFVLVAATSTAALLQFSTITHFDADAAQYVATARSLLRGHGYTTTLLFYPQQQAHPAPFPQTVWPPLFPILIATYSKLSGIPTEQGPIHISILAHILTATLLSALLARYLLPLSVSVLIGAIWFAIPEANRLILNGMSEPLFIFLTVLSTYVLAIAFDTSRGDLALLGLAGITAAGACLTRYQGIAFLAALIVAVFFLRLVAPGRRLNNRHIVALLTPPVLAVLWLFARNFYLVGSFSGGPANAATSETASLAAIRQLFWTSEDFLGLNIDHPLASVSRLILVPGMAIIVCTVTMRTLYRFARPMPHGDHQANGHLFVLVVAAAYVCATISLHLSLGVVAVSDARYLFVLTPFLIYLTATAVCQHTKTGMSRFLRWGTGLWLGLSLVAIGICKALSFEQSNWDYEWFAHGGNKNSKTILAALESRHDGISAGEFLKAKTEDGSAILSPEPFSQFGGIILDRPSVGLTPPVFGTTRWTPEAVAKLVRNTNVSLVCILTPPIGTYLKKDPEWWPIVWLLLEGKEPRWLRLAFRTDRIRVYEVDRSILPARPD